MKNILLNVLVILVFCGPAALMSLVWEKVSGKQETPEGAA